MGGIKMPSGQTSRAWTVVAFGLVLGIIVAGGEHPSLSEHSIRYIALYINTAEIARVYLHPVYSFPKVTFTIALDEGGSLRAIAEPTHSAGWEASKKIAVTP